MGTQSVSKWHYFSLVQLVQFSTESEDSSSAELVCVSVASCFDCYLIKGGGKSHTGLNRRRLWARFRYQKNIWSKNRLKQDTFRMIVTVLVLCLPAFDLFSISRCRVSSCSRKIKMHFRHIPHSFAWMLYVHTWLNKTNNKQTIRLK